MIPEEPGVHQRGAATPEGGGQLLLGVSSTLGDVNAVNAFAAEAGLRFTQIAELVATTAPFEIRMQLLQTRVVNAA